MELQKVYVPIKEMSLLKVSGGPDDKGNRMYCNVKETEAIILSKEGYDKIKDALNIIHSSVRSVIPLHVNIDIESDMALYNSFHASEKALQILNK